MEEKLEYNEYGYLKNGVLEFRFQSGIQNRTLLQESRDIQQSTN